MEQKTVQRLEKKEGTGPNLTGIPTQMKLDFEQRSGLSFDDVRVHYNSDKPAQLQALAYTQGTQVYVGPGQERHLPHELGHVVQQKLGLVRPTARLGNIPINNSNHMEQMADRFQTGTIQGVDVSGQAEDVIQYAGGVGVTLAPRFPKSVASQDVLVESIKFADRPDTGTEYQGSHSVALVFLQKCQREINKGATLEEAFDFYRSFVTSIKEDIMEVEDEEEDEEEDDPILADSKLQANKAEMILDLAQKEEVYYPINLWSIYLEKTIVFANNAYAKSPLATIGKGSVGLGERGGIKLLKKVKHGDPNRNMRMLANLIDMTATTDLEEDFQEEPIENIWENVVWIRDTVEADLKKELTNGGQGDVDLDEAKLNNVQLNAKKLIDSLENALSTGDIGRIEYRFISLLSQLFTHYENMPDRASYRHFVKSQYSDKITSSYNPAALINFVTRMRDIDISSFSSGTYWELSSYMDEFHEYNQQYQSELEGGYDPVEKKVQKVYNLWSQFSGLLDESIKNWDNLMKHFILWNALPFCYFADNADALLQMRIYFLPPSCQENLMRIIDGHSMLEWIKCYGREVYIRLNSLIGRDGEWENLRWMCDQI